MTGNARFAEPCRDAPLKLIGSEYYVERISINKPACHDCQQDIYLGIFFDGTNNNKYRDTLDFSHSNVARLTVRWCSTQTHLSFAFARTEWKPS